MKITVVSDLHLEFGPYGYDLPGGDLLLLPGDIMVAAHHAAVGNPEFIAKYPDYAAKLRRICDHADDFLARACAAYKNVLAIGGNHEHYGSDVAHTLRILESKYSDKHPNLGWLEKEAVLIDGVMIFGATLWTDFGGNDAYIRAIAKHQMNDYRKIWITEPNGDQRNISPEDVYEDHREAVATICAYKVEAKRLGHKFVVMTHHAPSKRSCHPRYAKEHTLNACYQTNLEHLMDDDVPLWVHGHTHDSYDYNINGTRVVCNPRGYLGDNPAVNPRFNPNLVIDL